MTANVVGMKVDIRGANGLVRILRVLLRLERVRRIRQVSTAELLLDPLADIRDRFRRNARRVGTHIGNKTDRAFARDLDAFIEALGYAHGAAHVEAKLARSILLQLAGGEWRGRVALPLLALNAANRPFRLLKLRDHCVGDCLVRKGWSIDGFDTRTLAVDPDKTGDERKTFLRFQFRVNGPVFDRLKCLDFTLALDDETNSHGLHAASRET